MQPGVAQCPMMGLLAGGHRHLGGSRWARPRPPCTARRGRGSTLQLLDAAMGATPQLISSSAPTTSCSTSCSLDGSARARPLGAKPVAGMATSWRTERQHLNQTARTTACSQSTSGPLARFPIGVPDPVISCRSGFTCPPHQAIAHSQATAAGRKVAGWSGRSPWRAWVVATLRGPGRHHHGDIVLGIWRRANWEGPSNSDRRAGILYRGRWRPMGWWTTVLLPVGLPKSGAEFRAW
jgi:hypothetical protein